MFGFVDDDMLLVTNVVPLVGAAQDEVIENAYATAQKFFQLPFEEKSRCDTGKEYGAP